MLVSELKYALEVIRQVFAWADRYLPFPFFEMLVHIPKGDEDAMYDLADAYWKAARELEQHAQKITPYLTVLRANWKSEGATAAVGKLELYQARMHSAVASLKDMGDRVHKTAQSIEAAKYMAIVNLGFLVYVLIQAIVWLVATGGASGVVALIQAARTRGILATIWLQLKKIISELTVRGALSMGWHRAKMFGLFTVATKIGIHHLLTLEGRNPTLTPGEFFGEIGEAMLAGFIGGPLTFGRFNPLTEGLAMAGGQFGENMIAAAIWDPERKLTAGVAQAGLFGTVMGVGGLGRAERAATPVGDGAGSVKALDPGTYRDIVLADGGVVREIRLPREVVADPVPIAYEVGVKAAEAGRFDPRQDVHLGADGKPLTEGAGRPVTVVTVGDRIYVRTGELPAATGGTAGPVVRGTMAEGLSGIIRGAWEPTFQDGFLKTHGVRTLAELSPEMQARYATEAVTAQRQFLDGGRVISFQAEPGGSVRQLPLVRGEAEILSQYGVRSGNESPRVAEPPARDARGPGEGPPAEPRGADLRDARPDSVSVGDTRFERRGDDWYHPVDKGTLRFGADAEGRPITVEVTRDTRAVVDAFGELKLVIADKASYEIGLDGRWSERPVDGSREAATLKLLESRDVPLKDGGVADIKVGDVIEDFVTTRAGEVVREPVAYLATEVYQGGRKLDGIDTSSPAVFLRTAEGLFERAQVRPEQVEAWLAGAKQSYEAARLMNDIAARSDERLPFEQRLNNLSAGELRDLLHRGKDDTAAAAYQIIKNVEGKNLRWSQMDASDAMLRGRIVNMLTGEGKSLAYLQALVRMAVEKTDGGVALYIPTRETLANRDFKLYKGVFEPFGIDFVRIHQNEPIPEPRPGRATIQVGEQSAVVFNSLGERSKVLGEGTTRVVLDEVDEASAYKRALYVQSDGVAQLAPKEVADNRYQTRDLLNSLLREGTVTEADFGRVPGETSGPARLTEAGEAKVREVVRDLTPEQKFRLERAAQGKWEFVVNRDFVIHNDKIIILEQTSHQTMVDVRNASESRWNDGVAQAIEAEHGLPIRADAAISRHMTMADYLRQVQNESISGASGTARGEAKQVIYEQLGMSPDVHVVKPYYESQLKILPDRHFDTEAAKINGLVDDIVAMMTKPNGDPGRPQYIVAHRNDLVATVAEALRARGVKPVEIDAKWQLDRGEAWEVEFQEVMNNAGKPGQVTVINMQGARGVDPVVSPDALAEGGLHVRVTGRSDVSGDIDHQAAARAARGGEPGSAEFYVSTEDALLRNSPNRDAHLAVIQYRGAVEGGRPVEVEQATTVLREMMPQLQREAEARFFRQMHPDYFPNAPPVNAIAQPPGPPTAPEPNPPPPQPNAGATGVSEASTPRGAPVGPTESTPPTSTNGSGQPTPGQPTPTQPTSGEPTSGRSVSGQTLYGAGLGQQTAPPVIPPSAPSPALPANGTPAPVQPAPTAPGQPTGPLNGGGPVPGFVAPTPTTPAGTGQGRQAQRRSPRGSVEPAQYHLDAPEPVPVGSTAVEEPGRETPPVWQTAVAMEGAQGGVGPAQPSVTLASVLRALEQIPGRFSTPVVTAQGIVVVPAGAGFALRFWAGELDPRLRGRRFGTDESTEHGLPIVDVIVSSQLPATGVRLDLWIDRIIAHEVAEQAAIMPGGWLDLLRRWLFDPRGGLPTSLEPGVAPAHRLSAHDRAHRAELIYLAEELLRGGPPELVRELEGQLGRLLDAMGLGMPGHHDPDARHVPARYALLDLPPRIGDVIRPLMASHAPWRSYRPESGAFDDTVRAAREDLVRRLDPNRPETSAGRIAEFFRGLESPLAERLATTYPETVGNLRGVPVQLRYLANETRVATVLAGLEPRVAGGTVTRRERHLYNALTALPRDGGILHLSLTGGGRIAHVRGDLGTAASVAVLVPAEGGLGNAVEPLDTARALHGAMADPSRTAVVTWIDHPFDAGDRNRAQPALVRAEALRDLRAQLDTYLAPTALTTVVSSGYSGLTVRHAIGRGAAFDQIVLLGSPGLGHDVTSVADLRLPAHVRVAAARSETDLAGMSGYHGPDPARFRDVVRLATDGQPYLAPDSATFQRVVLAVEGGLGDLTTSATAREPRYRSVVAATGGAAGWLQAQIEGTGGERAPVAAEPGRAGSDRSRFDETVDRVLPELRPWLDRAHRDGRAVVAVTRDGVRVRVEPTVVDPAAVGATPAAYERAVARSVLRAVVEAAPVAGGPLVDLTRTAAPRLSAEGLVGREEFRLLAGKYVEADRNVDHASVRAGVVVPEGVPALRAERSAIRAEAAALVAPFRLDVDPARADAFARGLAPVEALLLRDLLERELAPTVPGRAAAKPDLLTAGRPLWRGGPRPELSPRDVGGVRTLVDAVTAYVATDRAAVRLEMADAIAAIRARLGLDPDRDGAAARLRWSLVEPVVRQYFLESVRDGRPAGNSSAAEVRRHLDALPLPRWRRNLVLVEAATALSGGVTPFVRRAEVVGDSTVVVTTRRGPGGSVRLRVDGGDLPEGVLYRRTIGPDGVPLVTVPEALLSDPVHGPGAVVTALAGAAVEGRKPHRPVTAEQFRKGKLGELAPDQPVPTVTPRLERRASGQWAGVETAARLIDALGRQLAEARDEQVAATLRHQRDAQYRRLVEALGGLGMMPDQPGSAERRNAVEIARGNVFRNPVVSRALSPLHRGEPNAERVLASLNDLAPLLVHPTGARGIQKVPGQPALKVMLDDGAYQDRTLPVTADLPLTSDRFAVLTEDGSGWRLRVRPDASRAALALDAAQALSEFVHLNSGVTDPHALDVEGSIAKMRFLHALHRVTGPLARPAIVEEFDALVRGLSAGASADRSRRQVDAIAGGRRLADRLARRGGLFDRAGRAVRATAAEREVSALANAPVVARHKYFYGRVFGGAVANATALGVGLLVGRRAELVEAQIISGVWNSFHQAFEDGRLQTALFDKKIADAERKAEEASATPAATTRPGAATARPQGPRTVDAPVLDPYLAKRLQPTVISAGLQGAWLLPSTGWTGAALGLIGPAANGMTFGYMDYWFDKYEPQAVEDRAHFARLLPMTQRYEAVKTASFTAKELYERIDDLATNGRLTDALPRPARTALIEHLRQVRVDLDETMRDLASHEQDARADIDARRSVSNLLYRGAVGSVQMVRETPEALGRITRAAAHSLTRSVRGRPAPTTSAVTVREGMPPGRAPTANWVVRSAVPAAAGAAGFLMANVILDPAMIPFTILTGATSVTAGIATGYGWAHLRDAEIADKDAIAVLDAANWTRAALYYIDHVLHRLGDPDANPAARPAPGTSTMPPDAHFLSVLAIKHGPAIGMRLITSLLAGPPLLSLSKPLAEALLNTVVNAAAQGVNQTAFGAGEGLFRKLAGNANRAALIEAGEKHARGLTLGLPELGALIREASRQAWIATQASRSESHEVPPSPAEPEEELPETWETARALRGAPGGEGPSQPAETLESVLRILERYPDRFSRPVVTAAGVLVVPHGAPYALRFWAGELAAELRGRRWQTDEVTETGLPVVEVVVSDRLPGLGARLDGWVARIVAHEKAEQDAVTPGGLLDRLRHLIDQPRNTPDTLAPGVTSGRRLSPDDLGRRAELIYLAKELQRGGPAELERQLGHLLDAMGLRTPTADDPDARHVPARYALLDLDPDVRDTIRPLTEPGAGAEWVSAGRAPEYGVAWHPTEINTPRSQLRDKVDLVAWERTPQRPSGTAAGREFRATAVALPGKPVYSYAAGSGDRAAPHWLVEEALNRIPVWSRGRFGPDASLVGVLSELAEVEERRFRQTYQAPDQWTDEALAEFRWEFAAHVKRTWSGGLVATHRRISGTQTLEARPGPAQDLLLAEFGLLRTYVDRMVERVSVDRDRGVVTMAVKGDRLHTAAAKLANENPKFLVVAAHAESVPGAGVLLRIGSEEVSAAEFVQVLQLAIGPFAELRGRDLMLLTCDAAVTYPVGLKTTSLAAEISKLTGRSVVGAEGLVWVRTDGRVVVASDVEPGTGAEIRPLRWLRHFPNRPKSVPFDPKTVLGAAAAPAAAAQRAWPERWARAADDDQRVPKAGAGSRPARFDEATDAVRTAFEEATRQGLVRDMWLDGPVLRTGHESVPATTTANLPQADLIAKVAAAPVPTEGLAPRALFHTVEWLATEPAAAVVQLVRGLTGNGLEAATLATVVATKAVVRAADHLAADRAAVYHEILRGLVAQLPAEQALAALTAVRDPTRDGYTVPAADALLRDARHRLAGLGGAGLTALTGKATDGLREDLARWIGTGSGPLDPVRARAVAATQLGFQAGAWSGRPGVEGGLNALGELYLRASGPERTILAAQADRILRDHPADTLQQVDLSPAGLALVAAAEPEAARPEPANPRMAGLRASALDALLARLSEDVTALARTDWATDPARHAELKRKVAGRVADLSATIRHARERIGDTIHSKLDLLSAARLKVVDETQKLASAREAVRNATHRLAEVDVRRHRTELAKAEKEVTRYEGVVNRYTEVTRGANTAAHAVERFERHVDDWSGVGHPTASWVNGLHTEWHGTVRAVERYRDSLRTVQPARITLSTAMPVGRLAKINALAVEVNAQLAEHGGNTTIGVGELERMVKSVWPQASTDGARIRVGNDTVEIVWVPGEAVHLWESWNVIELIEGLMPQQFGAGLALEWVRRLSQEIGVSVPVSDLGAYIAEAVARHTTDPAIGESLRDVAESVRKYLNLNVSGARGWSESRTTQGINFSLNGAVADFRGAADMYSWNGHWKVRVRTPEGMRAGDLPSQAWSPWNQVDHLVGDDKAETLLALPNPYSDPAPADTVRNPTPDRSLLPQHVVGAVTRLPELLERLSDSLAVHPIFQGEGGKAMLAEMLQQLETIVFSEYPARFGETTVEHIGLSRVVSWRGQPVAIVELGTRVGELSLVGSSSASFHLETVRVDVATLGGSVTSSVSLRYSGEGGLKANVDADIGGDGRPDYTVGLSGKRTIGVVWDNTYSAENGMAAYLVRVGRAVESVALAGPVTLIGKATLVSGTDLKTLPNVSARVVEVTGAAVVRMSSRDAWRAGHPVPWDAVVVENGVMRHKDEPVRGDGPELRVRTRPSNGLALYGAVQVTEMTGIDDPGGLQEQLADGIRAQRAAGRLRPNAPDEFQDSQLNDRVVKEFKPVNLEDKLDAMLSAEGLVFPYGAADETGQGSAVIAKITKVVARRYVGLTSDVQLQLPILSPYTSEMHGSGRTVTGGFGIGASDPTAAGPVNLGGVNYGGSESIRRSTSETFSKRVHSVGLWEGSGLLDDTAVFRDTVEYEIWLRGPDGTLTRLAQTTGDIEYMVNRLLTTEDEPDAVAMPLDGTPPAIDHATVIDVDSGRLFTEIARRNPQLAIPGTATYNALHTLAARNTLAAVWSQLLSPMGVGVEVLVPPGPAVPGRALIEPAVESYWLQGRRVELKFLGAGPAVTIANGTFLLPTRLTSSEESRSVSRSASATITAGDTAQGSFTPSGDTTETSSSRRTEMHITGPEGLTVDTANVVLLEDSADVFGSRRGGTFTDRLGRVSSVISVPERIALDQYGNGELNLPAAYVADAITRYVLGGGDGVVAEYDAMTRVLARFADETDPTAERQALLESARRVLDKDAEAVRASGPETYPDFYRRTVGSGGIERVRLTDPVTDRRVDLPSAVGGLINEIAPGWIDRSPGVRMGLITRFGSGRWIAMIENMLDSHGYRYVVTKDGKPLTVTITLEPDDDPTVLGRSASTGVIKQRYRYTAVGVGFSRASSWSLAAGGAVPGFGDIANPRAQAKVGTSHSVGGGANTQLTFLQRADGFAPGARFRRDRKRFVITAQLDGQPPVVRTLRVSYVNAVLDDFRARAGQAATPLVNPSPPVAGDPIFAEGVSADLTGKLDTLLRLDGWGLTVADMKGSPLSPIALMPVLPGALEADGVVLSRTPRPGYPGQFVVLKLHADLVRLVGDIVPRHDTGVGGIVRNQRVVTATSGRSVTLTVDGATLLRMLSGSNAPGVSSQVATSDGMQMERSFYARGPGGTGVWETLFGFEIILERDRLDEGGTEVLRREVYPHIVTGESVITVLATPDAGPPERDTGTTPWRQLEPPGPTWTWSQRLKLWFP